MDLKQFIFVVLSDCSVLAAYLCIPFALLGLYFFTVELCKVAYFILTDSLSKNVQHNIKINRLIFFLNKIK